MCALSRGGPEKTKTQDELKDLAEAKYPGVVRGQFELRGGGGGGGGGGDGDGEGRVGGAWWRRWW